MTFEACHPHSKAIERDRSYVAKLWFDEQVMNTTIDFKRITKYPGSLTLFHVWNI